MSRLSSFDLYALFCVDGIGSRKINRLLSSDQISFDGIDELKERLLSEDAKYPEFLNREDIKSLKALNPETVRAEYDALLNGGIDMITIDSDLYPALLRERLELDSPPILFCLGNSDIIKIDSVGIVGSRDVSSQALEFAARIVEGFKDREISIISGGARGIDSAAHYAAIECGLKTVVVAANGSNHLLKKGGIRDHNGNAIYVSQFHPNSAWSPINAMTRNKTVCAMSKAVFVVVAGECSGTINTGEAALRMGVPLYVISPSEFDDPPNGNRYLISKGGQEIHLDLDPGRAACFFDEVD
jgi:DNA protecting protein DprA